MGIPAVVGEGSDFAEDDDAFSDMEVEEQMTEEEFAMGVAAAREVCDSASDEQARGACCMKECFDRVLSNVEDKCVEKCEEHGVAEQVDEQADHEKSSAPLVPVHKESTGQQIEEPEVEVTETAV